MLVSVSARHGSLQAGDQELIEEKVSRLKRLLGQINAIEVTVNLEHQTKPTVELRVSAEHVDDCVAGAESSNVIAALDLVIPKMEQQLRRIKEKMTGHRGTGLKHLDPVVDDEP